MNAPRSKTITVGGREFVVRPLLAKVARDLADVKGEGMDQLVSVCALVLCRMAPDITPGWLMENADVAELGDVMAALSEVTAGKSKGEAVGP
jgi:hypothetical protein